MRKLFILALFSGAALAQYTPPSGGGGGGAPSGPAGGDLSGTYPNPGVAKLGGVAAASYVQSSVTTLSSLASIGTITTGVWHGTAIANLYLANTGTSVNGATCTLGSSCTPAPYLSNTSGDIITGAGSNAIQDSGVLLSALPTLAAASNTFTGQQIITVAGAASTSPLYMTGAVFAGTATTSYPYVYHNVGASQPVSWNTSGTVFGANEASGYLGNFLDFHVNGGSSIFNIQSNGNLYSAANLLAGSSSHIGFNSRALLLSPADSEISLTNNAATGFTYLDLGPDTNTSFIRLAVITQANPILRILDANGGTTAGLQVPSIKSTTGTRYVCVDTSGNLSSSAAVCSGT